MDGQTHTPIKCDYHMVDMIKITNNEKNREHARMYEALERDFAIQYDSMNSPTDEMIEEQVRLAEECTAEKEQSDQQQEIGQTVPIERKFKNMKYAHENSETIPCDGRELSREKYSQLFNKIGTKYGEGDGETTFNIPDTEKPLFENLLKETTATKKSLMNSKVITILDANINGTMFKTKTIEESVNDLCKVVQANMIQFNMMSKMFGLSDIILDVSDFKEEFQAHHEQSRMEYDKFIEKIRILLNTGLSRNDVWKTFYIGIQKLGFGGNQQHMFELVLKSMMKSIRASGNDKLQKELQLEGNIESMFMGIRDQQKNVADEVMSTCPDWFEYGGVDDLITMSNTYDKHIHTLFDSLMDDTVKYSVNGLFELLIDLSQKFIYELCYLVSDNMSSYIESVIASITLTHPLMGVINIDQYKMIKYESRFRQIIKLLISIISQRPDFWTKYKKIKSFKIKKEHTTLQGVDLSARFGDLFGHIIQNKTELDSMIKQIESNPKTFYSITLGKVDFSDIQLMNTIKRLPSYGNVVLIVYNNQMSLNKFIKSNTDCYVLMPNVNRPLVQSLIDTVSFEHEQLKKLRDNSQLRIVMALDKVKKTVETIDVEHNTSLFEISYAYIWYLLNSRKMEW
jgi:hypothetical protein